MKNFIVHFHDEELGYTWNIRAPSSAFIRTVLNQRGSKVVDNGEIWEGKIDTAPSFSLKAWKKIMSKEHDCGPEEG